MDVAIIGVVSAIFSVGLCEIAEMPYVVAKASRMSISAASDRMRWGSSVVSGAPIAWSPRWLRRDRPVGQVRFWSHPYDRWSRNSNDLCKGPAPVEPRGGRLRPRYFAVALPLMAATLARCAPGRRHSIVRQDVLPGASPEVASAGHRWGETLGRRTITSAEGRFDGRPRAVTEVAVGARHLTWHSACTVIASEIDQAFTRPMSLVTRVFGGRVPQDA